MHIVLGISATADDVTAALVDVELPHLGPVDERVTDLGGDSAAVGSAVATAVGLMRLRAARADLPVWGTAVLLESPALREPIARALADQRISDVTLVDSLDTDLSYPPAVAVAVSSDAVVSDAQTGPIPVVLALPEPVPSDTRRGYAVVGAGIAAAVVAGSFAVWAVTGARDAEIAGVTRTGADSVAESNATIEPNPAAPDSPAARPGTGAPGSTQPGVPATTSSDGLVIDPGPLGTGAAPAPAAGSPSSAAPRPRPASPSGGSSTPRVTGTDEEPTASGGSGSTGSGGSGGTGTGTGGTGSGSGTGGTGSGTGTDGTGTGGSNPDTGGGPVVTGTDPAPEPTTPDPSDSPAPDGGASDGE